MAEITRKYRSREGKSRPGLVLALVDLEAHRLVLLSSFLWNQPPQRLKRANEADATEYDGE